MRRLTMAAALSFAAFQAFGAAADDLKAVEKEWSEAVQSGDYAKLDGMLSPNLIYTHSTGNVEDKMQYMGKLKTGEQKYTGIEESDVKVNTYGNTGVVTATVHMVGSTKGTAFDNRMRVIHVWIKQGSRWQLVAHQTTRIP